MQRHRRAQAGGGNINRLALGFLGKRVIGGNRGRSEASQSRTATRSAKAGMIYRPHFDRFFAPSAGKSAGIPLGPLGVAAKAQEIGLRVALAGGRGTGGENLEFTAIKIDRLSPRTGRIDV